MRSINQPITQKSISQSIKFITVMTIFLMESLLIQFQPATVKVADGFFSGKVFGMYEVVQTF